MIANINKFWKQTPNIIIIAIAVAIVALGVGTGVSFVLSTGIKISKEGVEVERQAYKNQAGLEKADLVIDSYGQAFEQVQEKAKEKSRTSPQVRAFAEEIEGIEQVVPKSQIEDIKSTILESQAVLENHEKVEIHRHPENKRPDS